MRFLSCYKILGILMPLLLQPAGAWAVLGGSAATVGQDGQSVTSNARQLAQPIGGIQEQTILTAQNVTVTEYTANGLVFAIRWSGPVMPDLSVLLGTYFPQYASHLPVPTAATRNKPILVRSPGLVVHANGHMRAYTGSAYAPSLVPSGLNLNTLGVDP